MKPALDKAVDDGAIAIHDCWNKIGVQGDLSCPELVAHVHCRNCPIYFAAAATLLDRAIPDGHIAERSAYFAQTRQAHSLERLSLTIFRIGVEWLALPTSALVEVVDLRPIHTLPHRTGGLLSGLVNVRGELLICVSLGKLLGLEQAVNAVPKAAQAVQTVYARLLVIQGEGGRMVFPADEVHGVERCDVDTLQKVPATVARATATYSTAILPWRGHAVGCLDDQLVFHTLNRSLA